MKPFTRHVGLVVPMDRPNVDTDQIIPKQFLKRIERTGFGEYLFFDWRRLPDGADDPNFELHLPQFRGATVLLARRNFGCGSSREHAPWALEDFGFRVLIAPSFADIFYNNCFKNGLLPIRLPEDDVELLFRRCAATRGYTLDANLEDRTLRDSQGFVRPIEIDEFRRRCLLDGLDDIGLTLAHEDKIAAYETARGLVGPSA